jgi:ABC-type nitrate/sulfonate/bicarbonate transport system permease component
MKRESIERIFDIALACAVFVLAWQVLSLVVGARTLTPPFATAQRIAALLTQPSFMRDIAATGRAYGLALVIGMAGGVALGTLFGGWRALGDPFEPLMHIIVATPKVTLYPVILLLFGLGDPAKIAFGVLHGLPPVAILTAAAIRSLKPIYRKAALTMRLSSGDYARRILVPAVAPEIFAGLRVCFAQALLGVLVGEMFASSRGVGHLLMASIGVDDTPTTLAIVVLVFLFAGLGNAALLALGRRGHG